MRISDWSSDVCSSDLHHRRLAACLQDWAAKHAAHHDEDADIDEVCRGFVRQLGRDGFLGLTVPRDGGGLNEVLDSSEEGRGGKGGVRTCRSRWWPYH